MANIVINSHDILGKLTIIKACLSVLTEGNKDLKQATNLLNVAYKTNEEIISVIKKISEHAQNPNR